MVSNSKPRPNSNRSAARSSSVLETATEAVNQMKAASDLLTQSASSTAQITASAKQTIRILETSVDLIHQVAQDMRSAVGGTPDTGLYGPGLRPAHVPYAPFAALGFGYPGGTGYGMGPGRAPGASGGAGHGGGGVTPTGKFRGGMGGVLGAVQARVATAVHHGSGIGSYGGQPVVRHTVNDDGTVNLHGQDGGILGTVSGEEFAKRAAVSSAALRLGGASSVMGMLRAVPEIAAPIAVAEAAWKGGNFIGNQRAANAAYQSIYGPGTSGFDQRMSLLGGRIGNSLNNLGSMFGFSSGGLSDSDYQKAFKGISALGYSGDRRSQAMNFTTKNFNSMGMSVDESLQLAGVNAQKASENFTQLSDQLKQVSTMAQQAGQNADVFRQKFIQAYSTGVQGGLGPAAGPLAVANTANTVGLGRQFSGMNLSSMYSTMGGQQVLASSMGYSNVLSYDLASSQNPMVMAQGQQNMLNRMLNAAGGPDVEQLVLQQIDKVGGKAAVVQDTSGGLALKVATAVQKINPNALNTWSIQSAFAAAGVTNYPTDPQGLAIYYIKWLANDKQGIVKQVAAQEKAVDQKVISKVAPGDAALAKKYGAGVGQFRAISGGNVVEDPILKEMQSDQINNVIVQTKNGQATVSLTEAEGKFRDQLTKGTAIIADGLKKGQTVGQAYGTEVSAHYKDTTGTAAPKDALLSSAEMNWLQQNGIDVSQLSPSDQKKLFNAAKKGLTGVKKEALKLNSEKSSGATGQIYVSMTPALAKYLNITGSQNVIVNNAAQNNSVPGISGTGSSTVNYAPTGP